MNKHINAYFVPGTVLRLGEAYSQGRLGLTQKKTERGVEEET